MLGAMGTRSISVVTAAALWGCAPTSAPASDVVARLARLEREVAAPGGAAQRHDDTGPRPREEQCVDDSFPGDTQFPAEVAFELGRTDLRAGDAIVIDEVHGTAPHFGRRGIYQVRGHYTLASAERALLAFSATAHEAAGCTHGTPWRTCPFDAAAAPSSSP